MRRQPTTLRRQHSSFFLGSGGVRFRLVDHYHRRHDFTGVVVRLWLTCCIIGISAAVIALVVDLISSGVYELRVGLCEAVDEPVLRYVSWLGTSALAALSATLLLKVVPHAAGSGLPEVKEALMGIVLFDSFSTKCLLIKPVSLALALASSLSIGKEGPFIHCACIVAFQLVNGGAISFSNLVREQRELEAIITACAAGVVCTFGAPVGGVLFSAEITSTGAYAIEHLPRAFFCVTLSLSVVYVGLRPLLLLLGRPDPLALFTTSFEAQHRFSACDMGAFAVQGALAALLADFVVRAVRYASAIRPYLRGRLGGLSTPSLVAMLCSATNLALSGGECRGSYTDGGAATLGRLINAPFRGATLAEEEEAADAETPLALFTLLAFALLKLYVLSPLSLAMPTPTGVFLPTFVGGAASGHAYAVLLRRWLPNTFALAVPGHCTSAPPHNQTPRTPLAPRRAPPLPPPPLPRSPPPYLF